MKPFTWKDHWEHFWVVVLFIFTCGVVVELCLSFLLWQPGVFTPWGWRLLIVSSVLLSAANAINEGKKAANHAKVEEALEKSGIPPTPGSGEQK